MVAEWGGRDGAFEHAGAPEGGVDFGPCYIVDAVASAMLWQLSDQKCVCLSGNGWGADADDIRLSARWEGSPARRSDLEGRRSSATSIVAMADPSTRRVA